MPYLVEELSSCQTIFSLIVFSDEAALKEKITGEEEVRCDLCIREYTAVALCIDCVAFLCSHCHKFHKYSREYQGHSMSQSKELRAKKKDFKIQPKTKP